MKNKKTADGRYRSKVYLGDGKYKYLSASSNKELAEKVNEVKLMLGKGLDISAAERDTFGDWAERWLKLKKTEISAKRYNSYAAAVKRFALISNMPIAKIRAVDIQDIISDCAESGLAKQTLTLYKSTCSQIFKLAIENRVIEFNPAEYIKIPKAAPQETKRALTAEERQWIEETPHRAQRAAMIMLYAGLRRGELIALTWRDIDLNECTISINKSVEMINSKPVVKYNAKTDAGMRIVNIPQKLVDFLKNESKNNLLVCTDTKGNMLSEAAWKRMWESYIRELNFKYGDFSGIVMPDESGNLTNFKKPKSRFAPTKIPIVIPRFTAHWLRHTFITLLYMAGVDALTAKEQAGHADVSTTMEIYTHLDSKFKKKQINKLDEFLQKAQ